MATARQIVALLDSHVHGDNEQFLSIALQVAASEAQRGRQEIAGDLRRLVDVARSQVKKEVGIKQASNAGIAIPIAQPKGELQSLLTASYPKTRIDDIVAPSHLHEVVQGFVTQQKHRDRLRAHGQVPDCRLLLVGPPGLGKTFTAEAIAGELHLPLLKVRLDSLITRFMGETAAKLRLVFDQIASVRGVYLFDEFDALGGHRSADNDVGEMRRVLNSFLQFLEEPNSTDSIVVAATNHAELLDRALFRRFDEVIEYVAPNREEVVRLIEGRLQQFKPARVQWTKVVEAANGMSHADLARTSDQVIRQAILKDEKVVTNDALVGALKKRRDSMEVIRRTQKK
jgi:AAA+ superfamily predicted ATPase